MYRPYTARTNSRLLRAGLRSPSKEKRKTSGKKSTPMLGK
jgi:hypothetical protein